MRTLPLAFLASLLLASAPALAQLKVPAEKPAPGKLGAKPAAKPAAEDPLAKYIEGRFKRYGGRTLCIVEDTPVAEIRREVVEEAKRRGAGASLTEDEVEIALLTRYPCPFAPYREELRPATARDIEGVWLFPEGSQPFRFGPKSPNQPGGNAVAIKCEIVGYYPEGEFRNGVAVGEEPCPFAKASDLQAARSRPRTISWRMAKEGQLLIKSPDSSDEWEIYSVKTPFGMHKMEFKVGDLVAYLRKEKGNDMNAATEFRHLQRLP